MIESGQDALSLVGQAWDVWLTATSSSSLTSDESTSQAQNGRLCVEEPVVSSMPHKKALCYGFCPTQDEFFLLRCKDCGLLVKPIAYRHHQNTRHAVRRPSQDMHDREPNCSSRIRHDSGPTPGLSVFSPDSSSHTPDDFDGILLSPVAAHPTSSTPEGARLRRDSQPPSPPICASQETRTRPLTDASRRKPPPNSRTKKTLRTILPVKAPLLRDLAVKAEEPDTYCVKQHGDLVMKFSKNISQSGNNGSDIRVENRKSRSRRKQELTVSPSPNGKGSNVIKSIDLVTPPCTPDRLKADIAGAYSQSGDILRTTSCAPLHSTKLQCAEGMVLDEEWSSSSVGAEYSHTADSNNNKHPKPQSSGACIVRLHARAPPFAAACLPAFDRRIDRLRTGLQKTVQAPIAQPLLPRGPSLEPNDVRFVDSNAAQKREAPSLRQLLTSRTAVVDYPPAATPRITARVVPDVQPPPPRRQAVFMTTTGAATHNYAKASVAPPSMPTTTFQQQQQQQLTLAMHPPQPMTASTSTVLQQQWNRQQPTTGTTPTPPMTPSPGVSNKPQQQQLHPVVTTTAGSFVVHHHQPLMAQHVMQHSAAFQKPKKRPALSGGPQRKRPRGAQQRPPALILPPNATFAQVTSNNMGQWRKLSAKATHHTTVGSLPPGTTVLALPAQSQIAGLVESGQLKLLPINGQTSANGTTAFILPNKNGVVALGRAAMGGRSQPMSVKSLSIESTLGQQPLFVNLQTATHRGGALHMGHGQTACTLVQSGPNATIYRLPLSQSAGGGYSAVHQTALQSPVALETVHST